MSSLEDVIRSEPAGPAIVFRERPYGEVERKTLLLDILGLANALVDGPRFVIMGVRDDGPDERTFVGISAAELSGVHELCQTQISRFIEPSLKIDLESLELGGVTVAIFALNACNEPPYLLQENVSNSMREGGGWIRRSAEPSRLRRADLQQLFERAASSTADCPTDQPANRPADHTKIEVGFAGEALLEEITLAVLDLNELPSEVAGGKLRKLMEAKQASRDLHGKTTTRFERLMHVREFGSTQPYEHVSEDSLVRQFNAIEDENRDADDYYRYEIRAHQINIGLANTGAVDLVDGRLTLDIPHLDGLGVSEFICVEPDREVQPPEGYPTVDMGKRKIRVQSKIDSVPHGSTVPAFSEPIRVWVREPLAGQTLPVEYELNATNLDKPVVGTLRIHVGNAQADS
jgi:hypothetical protein